MKWTRKERWRVLVCPACYSSLVYTPTFLANLKFLLVRQYTHTTNQVPYKHFHSYETFHWKCLRIPEAPNLFDSLLQL